MKNTTFFRKIGLGIFAMLLLINTVSDASIFGTFFGYPFGTNGEIPVLGGAR